MACEKLQSSDISKTQIERKNSNEGFYVLDSGNINIPFETEANKQVYILNPKTGRIQYKYFSAVGWKDGGFLFGAPPLKQSYDSFCDFENDFKALSDHKKSRFLAINPRYIEAIYAEFYQPQQIKQIEIEASQQTQELKTDVESQTSTQIGQEIPVLRKPSNSEFNEFKSSRYPSLRAVNVPHIFNKKSYAWVLYDNRGILFKEKKSDGWHNDKELVFIGKHDNYEEFESAFKNIIEDKLPGSFSTINTNDLRILYAQVYISDSGLQQRQDIQEEINNPEEIGETILSDNHLKAVPKSGEGINSFLGRYGLRAGSYADAFFGENKELFSNGKNTLEAGRQYKLPVLVYKLKGGQTLSRALSVNRVSQKYLQRVFEYNKKYNPDFLNINTIQSSLSVGQRILIPKWSTGFYVDSSATPERKQKQEELRNEITQDIKTTIDSSTSEELDNKQDIISDDRGQIDKDTEKTRISVLEGLKAEVDYYHEGKKHTIRFFRGKEGILRVFIGGNKYEISTADPISRIDKMTDALDENFGEDRVRIFDEFTAVLKEFFPEISQKKLVEIRQNISYRRNMAARVLPYMLYAGPKEYREVVSLKQASEFADEGYLKKYNTSDFNSSHLVLDGIGRSNGVNSQYLYFTPMTFSRIGEIAGTVNKELGVKITITSGFRPIQYNSKISGASRRSAHQSGNAFDIGFTGLGRNGKRKVEKILRGFDAEGKIYLTIESDHYHITVTDPEVRTQYLGEVSRREITQNQKKEDLLALIAPDRLLPGEENRDTFRLGTFLANESDPRNPNILPLSSEYLLLDLVERYLKNDSKGVTDILKKDRSRERIIQRMSVMIQFLLELESSGGDLDARNTDRKVNTASGPFQYVAAAFRTGLKRNSQYYFSKLKAKDTRGVNWDHAMIPAEIAVAGKSTAITPVDFSAEQSINFWLVDIFKTPGSNKGLIDLLIYGKADGLRQVYHSHHTNSETDSATAKLVDAHIKKYERKLAAITRNVK